MIVEQIWTDNALRNFNYLIACPETGDALAIDPLDYQRCLATARENGWRITQILNTHEHGDHTGGNQQMIAATGAKLLAHRNAKNSIPGIDVGLDAGDVVSIDAPGTGGVAQAEVDEARRGSGALGGRDEEYVGRRQVAVDDVARVKPGDAPADLDEDGGQLVVVHCA